MEELKKKKTSKKGFLGFFMFMILKLQDMQYFLILIDIYKDKIYNILVNVINEIIYLSLNEFIFFCKLLRFELMVIL